MIRRVLGISYSPAGGTAAMTKMMAESVADELRNCSPEEIRVEYCDLGGDSSMSELDEETVVILGMPVYVGKIPLPAIKALKGISGGSAMTLALLSCSGRNYGNALYEIRHFAEERDFKVIGAGSIAISYRAARGSDRSGSVMIDVDALNKYAKAASAKVMRLGGCEVDGLKIKPAPLEVKGHMPRHKISRISPKAAAVAQALLGSLDFRRRASEWFL